MARPAVGNIGLGAESVNGRSRVPLPPTRDYCVNPSCSWATPRPSCQSYAPSSATAPPDRPESPAQRCAPRSRMPVGEVGVGAFVMRGQIARRFARGRVSLVVQHFRRRHIDVQPAGPAQPVAEVDVLHIHEVALVETADLFEGRRGAPAGTTRTASRPVARWAPAAPGDRSLTTGFFFHSGPSTACMPPRTRLGSWRADGYTDPSGSWTSGPRVARAGPASRGVQQRVDAAPGPTAHPDWPRRSTRRHLPASRDRAVHCAAVAEVGSGGEQPHAWIALDEQPAVSRPWSRCRPSGTLTGRSVACDSEARNGSCASPRRMSHRDHPAACHSRVEGSRSRARSALSREQPAPRRAHRATGAAATVRPPATCRRQRRVRRPRGRPRVVVAAHRPSPAPGRRHRISNTARVCP